MFQAFATSLSNQGSVILENGYVISEFDAQKVLKRLGKPESRLYLFMSRTLQYQNRPTAKELLEDPVYFSAISDDTFEVLKVKFMQNNIDFKFSPRYTEAVSSGNFEMLQLFFYFLV